MRCNLPCIYGLYIQQIDEREIAYRIIGTVWTSVFHHCIEYSDSNTCNFVCSGDILVCILISAEINLLEPCPCSCLEDHSKRVGSQSDRVKALKHKLGASIFSQRRSSLDLSLLIRYRDLSVSSRRLQAL